MIYTGTDHRYLDIDAAGTLHVRGEQCGPPNHPVGQDFVRLVDMTGDGHVDPVTLKEPWGYYRAIPESGWEPELTRLGSVAPFVALLDNGRFTDVDGDGAADFIGISGGHFHVYHNRGEQGWSPDPEEARIPKDCRADFTEPGTRLADMSGRWAHRPDPRGRYLDGTQHLPDRRWSTGRTTGTATSVTRWNSTLPLLVKDGRAEDPFPEGWQQERPPLTDVDGDGYDDVVDVRKSDVVVWLNQAGNKLSAPVSIPLTSSNSPNGETKLGPRNDNLELASLRVADIGGRGTIGAPWSPTGTPAALRWAPLAPERRNRIC